MSENFCIDICRRCKLRCVIRKRDGVVSHYGCFGRKTYKAFVYDFNKTFVIGQVFALSPETGEFVSPLAEFSFAKARHDDGKVSTESEMAFRMDDSMFYGIISKEYGACEYLPEMQLASWSEKEYEDNGGVNGNKVQEI